MEFDDTEEILNKIFTKAISNQTIFKNRNVLRADYIPSKLPFREKQIISIAEALSPLLKKAKCSNLFIYGKPGTGKTAVTKYVLQILEKKSVSPNLKIKFAYSNTRVAGTTYRVLFDISQNIGLLVPFTGLALNEIFRRISSFIESLELTTVLVMDEIDYLIKNYGDDLLYELTRANEQFNKGYLAIIGISNDLNFKEFLNPRVLSSLSEEEIIFPPYTVEELKNILLERSNLAFQNNIITNAAINLCAALSGSEHGDARRAIDLLRISAEVAERDNSVKIDEKHVRLALQKIEKDRLIEILKSLPLHPKILLYIITIKGKINSSGEIYDLYSKTCEEMNIDILTPRRISMLINELDLLGVLVTKIINKGRYGRTKQITPLIPIQLLKEIYLEDPIIKNFPI